MMGEVPRDPLVALEVQLSEMYGKHTAERAEWGKASSEIREEFKSEMVKVSASLAETMKSFGGGMELAHISADSGVDLEEALKSTIPRGKNKKPAFELGMAEKLQAVLEQWCQHIDKFLSDVEGGGGVPNSAGPMGIMDHWRSRMQKLTSVTEQLKRKDVKTVVTILTAVTKGPPEKVPAAIFSLLRRWKDIDMSITESANEAKDNVKYMSTLDKFVEPLYTGTPSAVMDSLPALMNSIKMIHTIARYFNTPERMTDLFVKITHAMIENCKASVNALEGFDGLPSLWKKDAAQLIVRLESCLKLNELFQETYRLTKEKLASNPKGKQFDFNEQAIFGRFDLFCRRVIKLIDLFSTIAQFRALGEHKLEGMGPLIKEFEDLAKTFEMKRHDLLAYASNDFDRDFVEFNVNIDALEVKLQQFINGSFESIKSIDGALNLLAKFKAVLQRESLKADLDDKVAIIFQSFGNELELVQSLYEEDKHNPPRSRNLPPVAGNITWCRHLLQRIETPMRRFEAFPQVFASKDGKRIVKMYNRIARTLVAYEYLWYNAWVESIDTAKAGLQATLIIRHPEDGKLYVNFDAEILQLIREAKCLDRMAVVIPEPARIVLLQEAKFKQYYNDLAHALREYARITAKIIPVTAPLLRPSLHDMEYRLRPGMITLTWTSMNIDAYKAHVHAGLARLEELVRNVNDVIENRVEKNLRTVSKTLLVYLPTDRCFSLDEFVSVQQDYIQEQVVSLQGKNQEVESAVNDLIGMISRYGLDPHIEPVSTEDCRKLVEHYNHFMYTALLNCAKSSLNALKKRVAARASSLFLYTSRPFFELEVQLVAPSVRLTPSLDEVQGAINKCATAMLGCSKQLYDWGQDAALEDSRKAFFTRITKDLEIVRVVLLLTGSIQGTRKSVADFLQTFSTFEWLWKSDADAIYKEFMKKNPVVDDYERELAKFALVDDQITSVHLMVNLGALSLNNSPIKTQLRHLNSVWKAQYSDKLHKTATAQLTHLTEYFKSTLTKLNREPDSLDSIKYLMDALNEIRDREASIDMQINPVTDMYALLEIFLPEGFMSKDEGDMRAMLRANWMKLRDKAEEVTETIADLQSGFRKKLLEDVKTFRSDVVQLRADYIKNGPMVKGISANEAQDRLRRFEDEFDIRNRKRALYCNGETLFALPQTDYPELDATDKELTLLSKLYSLFRDVTQRMAEWRSILWTEVVANVGAMTTETESFASRCKKMPKKLRDWDAYTSLKKQIEDFQLVLPVLQELSKASIQPRHWDAVARLTGTPMNVSDPEFRLSNLLDAPLVEKIEDIIEVTDGADKELGIQIKLADIDAKWLVAKFNFQNWKARGVPVLMLVGVTVEELEDAQMQLQTMLTMRYVSFFRERASEKLKDLSDTSDTLELWQKVQLLWCSLESVFLGGDIAKQMPVVAKKFQKIDKDFVNIMGRASEQQLVTVCCANEVLLMSLPGMYEELEKCQKSLEGYLEQKRNKFPRFYFVSNPVLLQILSQGSDPLAVQQYYEKIFDSISYVIHDKKDKFIIQGMVGREGSSEETIMFRKPVKVAGNIEEWLMDVLKEMQRTMKVRCEEAAMDIAGINNDLAQLRRFNDNTCGQYALLGIQLMWTTDCEGALIVCKKDKNSVKNANKKTLDVLTLLSNWCLQDLGSKMNRTKVETLVTIQVHARDVINDINNLYRARKINTNDDFAWLMQTRFYWEPDAKDFLDEQGAMRVRITDVSFDYQFEYLGCKERLVITPLTDRCFVTLAQAMNMYFGGAPAGPAGTGKTETTKDMGRALGLFVVVTNCTG
jgi:dynein heavy chain